ncbi:hypothetical protein HCH52_07825 [Oscillospiraceae bacterium HV4-5-C5C]|nr:hypothetical protein [Oscillospiraceae bacterium HV4-5-C5C]
MMTLYDLCSVYPVLKFQGDPQTPIKNLAYDSRRVGPGTLFVALRGQHDDGHHYLDQAAKRGAGAVVISAWPDDAVLKLLEQQQCALVLVSDTRDALAYVSARYYEYPSSHLQLIGCIAWLGRHRLAGLLSQLLNQLSWPAGYLDGMRQITSDQVRYIGRNHPEAPEIQASLAAMLQLRQKAAVLPLRYLDLTWRRQAYASFKVLILLNARTCLSSLETQALGAAELVLYNEDDPAFTFLRAQRESGSPGRLRSFGLSPQADLRASSLHIAKQDGRLGTKLTVAWGDRQQHELFIGLPGRYAVYHALAALAVCQELKLPLDAAASLLARISVPGRLQPVPNTHGLDIFIDQAWNDEQLEGLLTDLRPYGCRILTVLGGDGSRDSQRRVRLGKIAAALSDRCYLTVSDMRSENSAAIVADLREGAKLESSWFSVCTDRSAAIRQAIGDMRPGDLLLITGKGAETYEMTAEQVRPYSDLTVIQAALADLNNHEGNINS